MSMVAPNWRLVDDWPYFEETLRSGFGERIDRSLSRKTKDPRALKKLGQ